MRDGWIETTLGDLADWSSGKNIPKNSRVSDGQYSIIGANGEIGRTDQFLYDQPLVVVGRVGSCGETYLIHGKVWISDNALIALPNANIEINYLYYLLKTFDYNKIISGTTQPLITQGKLKTQSVFLPPLPEQKRIVDLISSVDSYIEALQQQLESAKRSRNAVLHELLTAGGDGWVETPIGDVAQVLSGFAFKSELFNKSEGMPLIRIRDLPKRYSTEALYSGSYEDRYIVKKGDFLIGMDGEFHCYEWNGPDALLNQRVCRIQDFKLAKVIPRYIYFAVNQYLDIIEQDTGYTTVKHISAKQVLGITIPLPPLPEQKRIVEIISAMDSVVSQSQLAITKAQNLRSGLLSDLLSGAHEIPASYDKIMGAA